MFRSHGRLHPGCREFTLGDDRVPGLAFQANLPRPGSAMPFVFLGLTAVLHIYGMEASGVDKIETQHCAWLNKQTNKISCHSIVFVLR